jgi:hypothetical protein
VCVCVCGAETDESHILVKDYDSMTIVLKCSPSED